MKIATVGNTFLDRILFVPKGIEGPGKMRASMLVETGGGIAATAAITCARLGAAVSLVSRIGDDYAADRILEMLARDRIDTGLLRRFTNSRSQQGTILVAPNGDRNAIGFMGSGFSTDADWIEWSHLSDINGIMADYSWPEAAEPAFIHARRSGAVSVLDADVGDMDAVRRLVGHPDYAIFSEDCIYQLTGRSDLGDALRDCARLTPAVVGVTAGPAGFFWLQGGQVEHVPAFQIIARDTNGAGDIFHGALTLALAEGQPMTRAARFASAAAALKCRTGSGWESIPDRAQTEYLMSKEIIA